MAGNFDSSSRIECNVLFFFAQIVIHSVSYCRYWTALRCHPLLLFLSLHQATPTLLFFSSRASAPRFILTLGLIRHEQFGYAGPYFDFLPHVLPRPSCTLSLVIALIPSVLFSFFAPPNKTSRNARWSPQYYVFVAGTFPPRRRMGDDANYHTSGVQ
jgi:hypothetical protein